MIVASWGTITARTLLEDGLAYFEREKAVAVNLLLSHYRTDSLDRTDSIRYWLKKRGDLSDHYSLAESFIATEEFDSCNTVLLNIPTLFQLDLPSLVSEHNDYLTYYQMRRTLHTEGRSIMELDSAEVQTLVNLAHGSNSRAAILADNILCFGYGICKDLSARDSSGSTARFAAPPMDPQKFIQSQYYQLKVFPNPASDYTTFEWNLVNLESAAMLRVFDATGREIAAKVVSDVEGQWLLDTRAFANGFYLYEMRDAKGSILAQGKLSLE